MKGAGARSEVCTLGNIVSSNRKNALFVAFSKTFSLTTDFANAANKYLFLKKSYAT